MGGDCYGSARCTRTKAKRPIFVFSRARPTAASPRPSCRACLRPTRLSSFPSSSSPAKNSSQAASTSPRYNCYAISSSGTNTDAFCRYRGYQPLLHKFYRRAKTILMSARRAQLLSCPDSRAAFSLNGELSQILNGEDVGTGAELSPRPSLSSGRAKSVVKFCGRCERVVLLVPDAAGRVRHNDMVIRTPALFAKRRRGRIALDFLSSFRALLPCEQTTVENRLSTWPYRATTRCHLCVLGSNYPTPCLVRLRVRNR